MSVREDNADGMDSRRPKPTVVGLYGIQGCGKTILLRQLRVELGEQDHEYYDGFSMIKVVICGGLAAFNMMDEKARYQCRTHTIDYIRRECLESGKVGIVAGHLSLPQSDRMGDVLDIYTEGDLKTYMHIL